MPNKPRVSSLVAAVESLNFIKNSYFDCCKRANNNSDPSQEPLNFLTANSLFSEWAAAGDGAEEPPLSHRGSKKQEANNRSKKVNVKKH